MKEHYEDKHAWFHGLVCITYVCPMVWRNGESHLHPVVHISNENQTFVYRNTNKSLQLCQYTGLKLTKKRNKLRTWTKLT